MIKNFGIGAIEGGIQCPIYAGYFFLNIIRYNSCEIGDVYMCKKKFVLWYIFVLIITIKLRNKVYSSREILSGLGRSSKKFET